MSHNIEYINWHCPISPRVFWQRTRIWPVTKMSIPCDVDGCASMELMRCWHCWNGSDVSFPTMAAGPCTF